VVTLTPKRFLKEVSKSDNLTYSQSKPAGEIIFYLDNKATDQVCNAEIIFTTIYKDHSNSHAFTNLLSQSINLAS